jgi:hypothetical protein
VCYKYSTITKESAHSSYSKDNTEATESIKYLALNVILVPTCWIIVLLPSTACGGIRPTETADGGYLRLPTEEQYLIYKQSLPTGYFHERQHSTCNENAFTWPVPIQHPASLEEFR